MSLLIRIVNAFYAALFLVMALVSLAFLSAARDGFGREPQDIWMSAAWAALFALFSLLSFVNLRRAPAGGSRILVALNILATLTMLAGLMVPDPMVRILCGASAVPFAATTVLLALRKRAL